MHNPGRFTENCITHALRFWFMPLNWIVLTLPVAIACWIGCVMLVRNLRTRALPFLSVIAIYPLTYVVTHVETRYRHPIEPLIYLLAAYGVTQAMQCHRSQRGQMQPGSTKLECQP